MMKICKKYAFTMKICKNKMSLNLLNFKETSDSGFVRLTAHILHRSVVKHSTQSSYIGHMDSIQTPVWS